MLKTIYFEKGQNELFDAVSNNDCLTQSNFSFTVLSETRLNSH